MATASSSSAADALRERGNSAFKEGNYKEAILQYTKVLYAYPRDAKTWNNRAQACLKLQLNLQAWGDAYNAHDLEPANLKALLRMAAAEEAMQLFQYAMATYAKCEELKLEAAEAAEVAKRSRECAAAAEAAAAAAGIKMEPQHGLHTREFTMPDMISQPEGSYPSASMRSMGAYRAFPGGPRDARGVIGSLSVALSHDVIKLAPIKGKGVGVVATKPIPAGTLVLADSPVLLVDLRGGCYHCLGPMSSSGGVPCSGGCDRLFCSAKCNAEAAKLYHAPLCRQAGGKAVSNLENRARRGTTSSSRTSFSLGSCSDVQPFGYLSRISDWSTPDDRDFQDRSCSPVHLMETWLLLRDQLDEEMRCHPSLSISWVYESSKMHGGNAFGVKPDDPARHGEVMGTCVSGPGSMFNHSCAANTFYRTFTFPGIGCKLSFITVKPVAAGEELTIPYLDPTKPVEERQTRLKGQYRITCTCSKCTAELAASGGAAVAAAGGAAAVAAAASSGTATAATGGSAESASGGAAVAGTAAGTAAL